MFSKNLKITTKNQVGLRASYKKTGKQLRYDGREITRTKQKINRGRSKICKLPVC